MKRVQPASCVVALALGVLVVAGFHAVRIPNAGSGEAKEGTWSGFFTVAHAAQEGDRWVISPRRAALPNPVPVSDEVIAKGAELYLMECSTCHGRTGQNDGPGARNVDGMHLSRVLTDPTLQEESDGSLYWKITEGRGGMPSTEKELTDEQRWMIVHYLRSMAK